MKRYITAFLLIIGCSILYVSIFITNTILSESYILNKMEEADYYQKIYENVHECFTNYTMQSGLEENVVQDIVTVDKIKSDTKIILDNFYNGTTNTIETDSIKEKLQQNIDNYLKENELNIQDKSSMTKFEDLIIQQYKNNISDYSKQNETIYNTIIKTKNIVNKAKGLGFIIVFLTLILFFITNKKKLIKIVSISGIVSMFFGIVFLIVKPFITSIIDINNFYLLNEPISEVVKLILNQNIFKFTVQGIIFVIIGLILIFLGNYIESKKKIKQEPFSK